ncbi:hypothetical protein CHS0354_028441 [Potamilus streckersoni]|uniref:EGF-like domain-containing protein n=1 Tax=Potamilus streckersoni TaxID=2493646 RepID=A0AAE0SGN3_9BIVA|nr:hypothetical protein CHS0354_028441 [Potamilus streckersoni]
MAGWHYIVIVVVVYAQIPEISSQTCDTGSGVLNGVCQKCGPGTYYVDNRNSGGLQECVNCPYATYQDLSQQFSCKNCPPGTNTTFTGASSVLQCDATSTCAAGSFRNTSGICQICPIGTYQSSLGQTSCISCPSGTTTQQTGSTSSTQCVSACSTGFFLNSLGNCQTCPIGTYQPSSGQTSCISCPSGTTTLQTGSTSSTQCVAACSTGFFLNSLGNCQTCPIGTYQPSSGQTSCISCPSGTTTLQTASTSSTQCVAACSTGFFLNSLGNCQTCPIGTYQPSSGQTSCISCPSGTTTLQTASTSSTQCVAACSTGFFLNSVGNCQTCPIGTYQPSSGQTSCISCPSGTTTQQTGSTSSTQCVSACSTGFFLNSLGNCQTCPIGTYQPSSGQTSCISCPSGTTTQQTGSTSSTQCVAACSTGFFLNSLGNCQTCPIGTYQPSSGQTSCISCPSGTTTLQTGSTSSTQCVAACSTGFFLNSLGNCQTCPIGTYQPSSGQTSCISCPSGTTTLQTASTSSTQCVAICGSGFFRSTSGTCQACPIGTYQSSTEQSSCISCPSGTTTNQVASTSQAQCVAICGSGFFRSSSSTCQVCPIGTYQPNTEQSSCISCPSGTTTNQVASTSQVQCVVVCLEGFFFNPLGFCQVCAIGTYQPSSGQTSCIVCQSGTTTLQTGSISSTQCVAICNSGFFRTTSGNCQACPIGTYQPSTEQSLCISCPSGTTTNQVASTSQAQCVGICSAGFFINTLGNCQACPIGSYQPSSGQSSCISCQSGTTTLQTGSSFSSQCIAICSAGFFINTLGNCQACSIGSYQPSSGQTSCILCQSGTTTLQTGSSSSSQCIAICNSGFFRNTNGNCQSCPVGTYQPSTEQTSCISCPSGTTTNQVASTSQTQCVGLCPAGFFLHALGFCQACALGTYQPSSGQTSCISCQTGTITLQTASVSSAQCVAICSSGFYRTTGGSCQVCPIGTYQPSTEQTSCISCPSGTSTNQIASTSQAQCVAICSPGFFLNTVGNCQACSIGSYQPSSGQTSCISCQSGTITLQTSSTSSSQCVAICNSGFFRNTNSNCQACPVGTYQPTTEQTSCISCPSGTTTNQVASTSQTQCVAVCSTGFFINTLGNCQTCPIGTYQPSSGQSSCISCPTGTITLQTGSISSSQCVAICNSGFFRNTSGICQSCPVGTYQPSTEQTSCISCPTGTTTNQVASTSQTQCVGVCGAGFFLHALGFCQACSLGTYQPSSGQTSCISCQSGTTTLQTASTSSAQCVSICSSGFYRTTGGSCQACPIGTYQPSVEQTSCISCPSGTSTNQIASTSQAQCVAVCSIGFFLNTLGNCQTCPIGTFQPSSGQTSCISCSTGTTTLQTGSTSSTQCVAICNSGFFRNASGICQSCPVGTYQPNTEQTSCISCPTGTTTNQVASISQTQCVGLCPAGFFIHALGFCQACALGTYQPSSGQTSCISCQTGTITLQTASVSSAQCVAICSSGFYRTTGGSCQVCPIGTYQPSTEQTSCISCPSGTSTNQIASTSQAQCVAICSAGFFINTLGNCQACLIGSYQPSSGQTSCISCQSGTTTLQTGSSFSSQCVAICNSGFFRTTSGNCQACPVGTYQPNTEQTSCISCPSGTTTNQVASTSQTQCVAVCSTGFFLNTLGNCQTCPVGTYQPSLGQTSCISCPTGTITLQTGSISSSQCVATCNSGFFRNTSGICQSCPVGTYQPSTEQTSCISCPTGTTTNQVASTSQTQCVGLCPAGFFLHALGFCQACALGTYQPSSGQTSCISCQTGTITLQTASVSSAQCVAICSSGFYRTTGGSCQVCPIGTYQPSTEQTSCISCPSGTSTNQIASTSQSQCVAICSAGFFINTLGNCQACLIGSYQPSSGQTSCISCQSGTTTLQTGSSFSSQCVAICNSGFFRTTNGNCQACPVGTYQPSTEQTSCISCPSGTTTNQVASTSQTQCVAVCSTGFFLNTLGNCQTCPIGTYQPSSGQSSCISCPTGTITLQTGSISSSQCVASCNSGFFRNASGICQSCPVGTYQPSTEQTSCISCPTGTTTNQVASISQTQCVGLCPAGFFLHALGFCQACALGTYQPSSGQTSCISCQTGTITLQTASVSSAQCVAICSSGFFRTTGGSCQVCPIGTYQPSTEQTSCISCPSGTSTNQIASTSQSQCVAICSAGFFINTLGNCQACLIGSYQPSSGQSSCISCQSGTTTLQTGSSFSSQCVAICNSGFFRTTNGNCQACPVGTYQPSTEQTSCISCPSGTTTNQVASTSQTQCVAVCSTGFFLNTLGNCQTCPIGTYQPSSGQSSCISCPTGTITLQTGSISSSQCVAICNPGFFRNTSGICLSCPVGTYQPSTEQTSCISCPSGTTTNQVASISQTQCVGVCGAGFFLHALGFCQACSLGTYQPSSGQMSCISCQSGTTTLQTASTSSTQCVALCNPGFFRIANGTCQACPLGTYQSSTEQSSCISCPSGTTTNQIASTSLAQCVGICSAGFFINTVGNCQACPVGTYQSSSGQSSCVSCQSGTTTLQTGSTSFTQCVATCASGFFRATSGNCQVCPVGTYQPNIEQSFCLSCPSGTTTNQVSSVSQTQCVAICTAGFYISSIGNCQACALGTYQPSSGQTSCISCQTGTTTLQIGSSNSAQCLAICSSGFYRNTSNSCQSCPVGTYQPNTEQTSCISCPTGTTTNQVASSSQTQCIAICIAGFFTSSPGNCQVCPIGTYQPLSGQTSCISCQSGTITLQTGSTSFTQCVATCSSGYFRATSGNCQACPIGTYQPNSEQYSCISCTNGTSTNQVASVSQTQCFAICATGFFINALGNCQACPVGTYQPSSGQSSCIACQTGTLTLQTGSTSSTQCVATCSPGFFRSTNNTCQACPGGTYQPNSEQSSCISCPSGTSTNQIASTSQAQCIAICIAGFFINSLGNCQSCPTGTFQPSSGQSNCISCQTGTITLQAGSISSQQCVAMCASGFYRDTIGNCQSCPLGSYQPNNEQYFCLSCPTGTSTNQVASVSQTQCISTGCAAGSYLPPGGTVCQTCQVGTYQPIANATSCILCSVGTFSASQGQISCTQCSAGSYQSNPGSTFCLPCAVGQYQNSAGQSFCTPCPIGTYKSQTGQGTCTPCPIGQTTNAIGSASSSDCFQVTVCNAGTYLDVTNNICRQCEIGFYQDQSNSTSCKLCGSGRITLIRGAPSDLYCLVPCLPGKYHTGNINTAICADCPLGQYQPTSGQQTCLNCASNKTTYFTGSAVCYDICTPGNFFSATSLSCQLCLSGTYQPFAQRTECFTCPSGYVSTTGATQCQVFCNAGQRIDSITNQCVPCEIGTYQPATSQSSCISCGSPDNWITNRTGSTSISDCRYFCPSGYYKVGVNSCEPCPIGTYKDNAIDRFGTCQQCPSQTTTSGTGTTSLAFCTVYLCPAGTFWSFTQLSCQVCPIGTYQPSSGTTSCINCASPKTTRTTGSTAASQCLLICQRGYFYNNTADRCDPCSVGFYQDITDQTFCKACSFGYTTSTLASISINDCIEICRSGLQYTSNGQCDACPRGTYRTSGVGVITCQNCPNGFITLGTSASFISECSIAACSPGTYRTVSNICESCSIGTYQPDYYQDSCRSCGPATNWLTDQVGSVRQDQCRFFCPSGYVVTTNTTCDSCQVGFYKDNRINKFSSCIQCPNNTLTSNRGSTSINDCILAQCPAGYERDNTLSGCIACAVGYYQPSVNQNDCIPCPSSYSTNGLASVSSADCQRYCPSGQELQNNLCVTCQRGYYKDNTISLFMACTRCPVNYVTTGTGTSLTDCSVRDCPSGTRRNLNDTGCIDCEVGYYQSNPYQKSCIQCAPGYSTRTTRSTSISQCERYCPPGTELISSTNQCNPCSIGFYSASGFNSVCTSCPLGFLTANTGSTSVSDCNIVACDMGTYRDVNTNTCKLCAIGEYQDRKYQTSCTSCGILVPTLLWRTNQTGSTSAYDCIYYCPSGHELRADGKCYICSPGLYKDNNINILSMCTVCPDGKVTPGEGAISQSLCTIRDCPAGFFANVNVDRCTPCGFATYQPIRNQTNCISCPMGTSTKQTGSTNLAECLPYCQSGYERVPNNATGCQACQQGFYKDNNLGIYSTCTQCPANFTTNRTAAVSSAECNIRMCPVGYYINQINQCAICPKGTYQDKLFQTLCVSCGPGQTTDSAGSDSITDCYQVLCPPGQHYLNGICQPCEIGYYKSGTNADRCQPCSVGFITLTRGSISSTDCSIPACLAGQYLLTSTSILECRSCPFGTYQNATWQRECKPCQAGYTTVNMGSVNADACVVECLDGQERNNVTGLCFSCPIGTYRKVGLNPKCMICPSGLLTSTTGSITDAECVLSPCKKGYRYLLQTQVCEICPRGMYQPDDGKFTCNDCPVDRYYTTREGATSATECRSPCLAGQGFNLNTQLCYDCPVGSYQPNVSSFKCIECPTGRKYTAYTASTKEADCLSYCGASSRNGCSLNATCTDDSSISDGYTCICNKFYTDTGVLRNLKPGRVCINQCDAGYCLNSGVCSMTESGPVCSCGDWYRGDKCQERLSAENIENDKSKWIIPLVVVVVVVILIVVAIIICCCFRDRCKPSQKPLRTSQYLESQPIVAENFGYIAPAPKMMYAVSTVPALTYEPANSVIFRDSTLRPGPELVYDNPAYHRINRRSGDIAIYEA